MKTLKFIGMVIVTILSCMSLISCSSDEENESNALKGYNLALESYKDYKDGEVVDHGINMSTLLKSDGTVEFHNSYDTRLYDGGLWSVGGNSLKIIYYDKTGEIAKTENYRIENVYSFGYFVLRLDVNSSSTDYRRVCGIIDSDDYDDAETPEWFEEEW